MNEQIRAALAPVATRFRKSQMVVRPISQVNLKICGNPDAFSQARKICLDWINRKAGKPLPQTAWEGAPFSLEEIGAQHAEAVAIDEPRYWAARIDDADRDIPSRTWITEIGIAEEDGTSNVVFGTRLTTVTRGDEVQVPRSIQTFVRQIVLDLGAALDGRKIAESPWLVADEGDVDELVTLIESTSRHSDVIVFSLPEGSTNPEETICSAPEVCKRTLGAAHVAVLTGPASFMLSDRVGKEFSVFRQAVRCYRPGFNLELDEPFAHPLALPGRIMAWPDGGARTYEKFVISQAIGRTVSFHDTERQLPSFLKVKRVAAELQIDAARDAGTSDAKLLLLYQKDNNDLRKAIDELKSTFESLLLEADQERDGALAREEQLRQERHHLRARIAQLENARPSSDAATTIPGDLSNFEAWCRDNLSGSVELHHRAFQGIAKSVYGDVSLIYKSLLLLRDLYVPMRREGGIDRKRVFDEQCAKLGVTEESTGSEKRAGEQGDEYFVRYNNKKEFLDRHLKKGNSREERYCFRLYFFWDEDNEQVVVGWLPSHLDSRIT